MAFRQAHKKTRTGCGNCKKRHVKCDESGPPCANCRIRGLPCNLVLAQIAGNRTRPILQSSGKHHPTQSIAVVGNRAFELELFHRWSTDTYRSFTHRPNDQDVWRLIVPQDALKYEFLLNAVFAIASLHVATTSGSHDHQLAALEYQNKAITGFQAETPSVTSANHQAMFAFSAINLALAVSLPCSPSRDLSLKERLVTIFKLLQGLVSIFESARVWLKSGPFQYAISPSLDRVSLEGLNAPQQSAINRLKAANDEGYRVLISDPTTSQQRAVSYYEDNLAAISMLEKCFSWYPDDGCMVCLRWPSTLEQSFVVAFTDGDPLAMLIVMHWAILLDKLSEEKWWAKSSGKMLITELSMFLKPRKPEWELAISWVHEQVGLPGVGAAPTASWPR